MFSRARAPDRPRGSSLLALLAGLALAGCAAVTPPSPPPAKPVFYPRPPDPPRIQYLTSLNASWQIVPERTGFKELIFGSRDEFNTSDIIERPYGIAVWNQKIYVCDIAGGAVKVFDLGLERFYILGAGLGLMARPNSIHIDSAGYKFVVESMRGVIHVFGPEDDYVTTFAIKDGRPAGVVAIGKELFVPDVTGDRILVLQRTTGKVVRTIGSSGNEPGHFLMPNAIAADAEGYLYVTDQMNYRLQKLNRRGKTVMSVGRQGDTYGSFARPRGLAVGPDGIIYMVESFFEVVQMFNQEGQVLMGFGNFHASPGFLELPASVAVDKTTLPYFSKYLDPRFEPEYLVFVTSQVGGARIGVYAFGRLKPGTEEVPLVPPLDE